MKVGTCIRLVRTSNVRVSKVSTFEVSDSKVSTVLAFGIKVTHESRFRDGITSFSMIQHTFLFLGC